MQNAYGLVEYILQNETLIGDNRRTRPYLRMATAAKAVMDAPGTDLQLAADLIDKVRHNPRGKYAELRGEAELAFAELLDEQSERTGGGFILGVKVPVSLTPLEALVGNVFDSEYEDWINTGQNTDHLFCLAFFVCQDLANSGSTFAKGLLDDICDNLEPGDVIPVFDGQRWPIASVATFKQHWGDDLEEDFEDSQTYAV